MHIPISMVVPMRSSSETNEALQFQLSLLNLVNRPAEPGTEAATIELTKLARLADALQRAA